MYRIASNRLFRTQGPTMKNDDPTRRTLLNNLIQVGDWRGRHGRRYDRSEDVGALIEAASEAIAAASEKILGRLPAILAIRRRLLRPFIHVARPAGDSVDALHRVLAECIVSVATRFVLDLEKALEAGLEIDEYDRLVEVLSRRAAEALDQASARDENQSLEVAIALSAERSLPAANDDARIVRITSAYEEATGKKVPSDAELAALTGLLASDLVTEPRVFAENLRRLSPPELSDASLPRRLPDLGPLLARASSTHET